MSGLVWNGVLGPSGRDRDAEQKQDPGHPANDLLINKKGAAVFMGVPPPAQARASDLVSKLDEVECPLIRTCT